MTVERVMVDRKLLESVSLCIGCGCGPELCGNCRPIDALLDAALAQPPATETTGVRNAQIISNGKGWFEIKGESVVCDCPPDHCSGLTNCRALKSLVPPSVGAEDRRFEFLLNAFEQASQSAHPSANGYLEKRRNLINFVDALARQVAELARVGIRLSSMAAEQTEKCIVAERERNALQRQCAAHLNAIGTYQAELREECQESERQEQLAEAAKRDLAALRKTLVDAEGELPDNEPAKGLDRHSWHAWRDHCEILRNAFTLRLAAQTERIAGLERDAGRYRARQLDEAWSLRRGLAEGEKMDWEQIARSYDAHSDFLVARADDATGGVK